MIHWGMGVHWLLICTLGTLLGACIFWCYYQLYQLVQQLDPRGHLLRNISVRRIVLRALLLFAALCLLIIVALRPQWGELPTGTSVKTWDVVIALDVSRSMLAQDIKPSRITVAERKLRDLVIALGADRVGLLFFSSNSLIQCPLTTDKELVLKFLGQAHDSIGAASTRLDSALSKLLDLVERGEAHNKVALLVTDGEDFSGDLSSVRERAQQLGVTIITLGIGTAAGAKIPVIDEQGRHTYLKDEHGNEVITKLNEAMLKSLAVQTGGFYVPLTSDESALTTIVACVEQQEQHTIDAQQRRQYQDHYGWFALAALAALILEWLL